MIPFLDVGAASREVEEDLLLAARRVVTSGWYILGREVQEFEGAFARWVEARHCLGVANGLDALTISLVACGVGPGDEVLVPSNTYIATWLAVTHAGARPVPVEPDPLTHVVTAAGLERAITPRTRALMPVHLYGQACEMGPIMALARARGLRVIDDAAQAHGARDAGRRVGALADATGWSYYPGKNLGALGDAGAITTDDDALAERIRALRNYGSRVKYVNEQIGWNSRLDEMQAALLSAKLPRLEEWNERRRRVAERYLTGLADLAGAGLTLPVAREGAEHAWHLFVVRSPRRDALQAHMKERGVETLVHYPIPPHRQKAYAGLAIAEGTLPVAEALAREVLSLPMGPHLSLEDVDRVVEAVRGLSN